MVIFYMIIQVLSLIGLLSGLLMFLSNKRPKVVESNQQFPTLSIIIPARNEELRLPLLLKSLKMQSWQNFELIVVDDGSTDDTEEVARSHGAQVFKSKQVGEMSPGKSNACAYGVRNSKGQYLLFLDADVQLAHTKSLEKILTIYRKQHEKGILSIQPYHHIKKPYENLSVAFNVIMLTGMNVFTAWKERFTTAGSFGPCILCDKESYISTGGHESAVDSIMDDFALSDVFLAKNLAVTNYLGKGIISMRMYDEGTQQLIEGWTKNLATASQSTHKFVMLLIQLWILGIMMVTIAPVIAFLSAAPLFIICSIGIYLVYGTHFYILARRAGSFHWLVIFMYPFFIVFFTTVFVYSLYRTHVMHSVMWKGRKIKV